MRISSRWLRGKSKESMTKKLLRSKTILEQLQGMLQEDLESVHSRMTDPKMFLEPRWAEHQAALIGEAKRLKRIIDEIIPTYNED